MEEIDWTVTAVTIGLVVLSNLGTYFMCRWAYWNELKQTGLLPIQVAMLAGKVEDISINTKLDDNYMHKFNRLCAITAKYREKHVRSMGSPSPRD